MQPQFENAKNTVKTLSVFDFDGTLTYHDSFIPFLKFAFGRRKFARRIIKWYSPHYVVLDVN